MLRLLPPSLINRIAAGEVLERPASAVKELVENALDAGADKIDVVLTDGGKESLIVIDNGKGMSPDELSLAVERHATSKLPTDDLFHLDFLGFRGEALPSIGSVARMTITSRPAGAESAWSLSVNGGEKGAPEPSSAGFGTRIEVRDMFYAVPARLKFLKSATTEVSAVKDILDRLALAYPAVSFTLSDEKKKRLDYPACSDTLSRIAQVVGADFTDNAAPVTAERNGVSLTGYVSLPTLNKATAGDQYFFVNGRPVRDKVLLSAIKGAYRALLPSDRFPVLVLYVTLPPEDVDMNVHPTKAEVRFRNAQDVRGIIVSAVRQSLTLTGCQTSNTLANEALSVAETAVGFAPAPAAPSKGNSAFYPKTSFSVPKQPSFSQRQNLFRANETYSAPTPRTVETVESPVPAAEETADDFPPLGLAKAQLHETYIVAQTENGIVIVDQHAAHERLTYEKMSRALNEGDAPAQYLLLPEVVEIGEAKAAALAECADELKKTGLLFEPFGDGTVLVRATPAILGEVNAKTLMTDLADTLAENPQLTSLQERLKAVVARMACHGSVRAGRKLDVSEMNALLRQMEAEPFAGQCIHGRPTYIELKLKDIERLFGRRD